MNYPAFEVFGTQHLLSLLICLVAIIGFPKLFQNQVSSRKILGGKIVAGLMILHMITQPIYDIFLFKLPWKEEFPLHMCDMSSIALIIFFAKRESAQNFISLRVLLGSLWRNNGFGYTRFRLWISTWGVLTIFLGS